VFFTHSIQEETEMKLAKAFEYFVTSKVGADKPATISWYKRRLKSLVGLYGETDLADIMPEDLDSWRAKLAQRQVCYENHPSRRSVENHGLSVYTLHAHIRACKTFFGFCMQRGYLKNNPAVELKRPQLPKEPPKHITDDDLDRLLLAAQDNPRDYAFIIALAATGSRIGGFVGLTWEQVDLNKGVIESHEKFGKVNEYYLTPEPLEALWRWRRLCEFSVVFPKSNGEPLTYDGLYQIIERCAREAGVEGRCNPHSFRHHKARELLENGASLEVVAEILKHENVATTAQFYGRWTKEEIRQKHQRYSRQHYPGATEAPEEN